MNDFQLTTAFGELFRPHAPTESYLFGIWACARCHRITYARGHEHNVATKREYIQFVEKLLRECPKMHGIANRCLAVEINLNEAQRRP